MSLETTPAESMVVRRRPRRPSWRHLALLAILLLAGFLRFWRLNDLPPGLYHDEAYNGLDALSLLRGETFPIFYEGWELYAERAHADRPVQESRLPLFFEGNYGREPVHIYLMALSISIFGPTAFAVRAVPAAAGVLAVLATYLTAGVLLELRPRQLALEREDEALPFQFILTSFIPLLAALTMAILYPAITFSRFGDREMVFIPIEVMTVYCFWRGIEVAEGRSQAELGSQLSQSPIPSISFKPGWFVAAGVLLGLGVYTYAAGRVFPFVFVAFVILWFWTDRDALRRQWGNVAVMAATSLLVTAPLFLFFARYPYYFFFRSRVVANRGLGTYPGQPWLTWTLNTGRVLRGLVWDGEANLLHNLPGRPFLDPIQFVLALGGLAAMVRRYAHRRHLFLLLWAGIMLLPSVMSGDAPHFGRMIGAAPPLAILVAMGAGWIGRKASNRLTLRTGRFLGTDGWGPSVGYGLVLLFVIVSALLTTWDYFGRYGESPLLQEVFDYTDWQLGRYAANLSEETTAYLTPTQEQMATIYFALSGERERLPSFYSPENGLLPVGKPGQPLLYLIRPHAQLTIQLIERHFPEGRIEESELGVALYSVDATANRVKAIEKSDVAWGGAIVLQGWTARMEGSQLVVTLYWQAQVKMVRSYTAYVHLLAGDGALVAQKDRPPDGYLTSDWDVGEVVLDNYRIDLPPGLAPRSYTLQTGFYFLPTQERLGEPQALGSIFLR